MMYNTLKRLFHLTGEEELCDHEWGDEYTREHFTDILLKRGEKILFPRRIKTYRRCEECGIRDCVSIEDEIYQTDVEYAGSAERFVEESDYAR